LLVGVRNRSVSSFVYLLRNQTSICLVEMGINIYRGYTSYHNHHLASRYNSEDLWLYYATNDNYPMCELDVGFNKNLEGLKINTCTHIEGIDNLRSSDSTEKPA
jgi:hypothetical protein